MTGIYSFQFLLNSKNLDPENVPNWLDSLDILETKNLNLLIRSAILNILSFRQQFKI